MINVEITPYSETEDKIKKIRYEVFVRGQNVPEEIETDGLDPDCTHVLLSIDGKPVGTGRIQNDGHIGRVAVLQEFRGKGFGTMIIKKLEEAAKEIKLRSVYLNSQCHAELFYKRLGYRPVGETFMEAGIEHVKMEKEL